MLLKDYFEHKDSKNWIIEHNSENYLLSYTFEDNKYYVDCLDHEYGYYDIDKFVQFVEPKTYTVNHCIEISQSFFDKLIENYDLLDEDFYLLNGFFSPVVVIDNSSCECAVEQFNSITLAMLWLYRGYFTSGHNDLWEDDYFYYESIAGGETNE